MKSLSGPILLQLKGLLVVLERGFRLMSVPQNGVLCFKCLNGGFVAGQADWRLPKRYETGFHVDVVLAFFFGSWMFFLGGNSWGNGKREEEKAKVRLRRDIVAAETAYGAGRRFSLDDSALDPLRD